MGTTFLARFSCGCQYWLSVLDRGRCGVVIAVLQVDLLMLLLLLNVLLRWLLRLAVALDLVFSRLEGVVLQLLVHIVLLLVLVYGLLLFLAKLNLLMVAKLQKVFVVTCLDEASVMVTDVNHLVLR